MRKLFAVSLTIALFCAAAAQAVTITENTIFPEMNLIVGQTNWNSQLGLQDRIINSGTTTNDLSIGQSFKIDSPTTLRAITIQNHSTKTWGAGTHVLELWVGANDGTASNFVAGATNVLTTIDLQNTSLAGLSYITFNLDSDLSLAAGNYGFQLNWTTRDSSNFMYAKRIDNGSTYTNGGWLYDTTIDGVLPFDDDSSPILNDLVFGLHSSTIGKIATFGVAPEEVSMLLTPPSTTTTGSTDVFFSSDTNMNIAVSIINESHAGSFSVLSATPQVITNTTTLDFEFDNSIAGLGNGETATGQVVIAWNEVGSTTTNEVVVPISVANGVAAADNAFTGTVSDNWGNPSNWDQGRVPGSLASDPAFIQNGLTATVTTNFSALFPWGTTVRGGATLNIDADLLGMTYIRLGYDASHYGMVNQSAGDVDASTQLLIGESTGSAVSNSVYTLSGGTLDLLGNSTFSVNAGSVFDVNGGAFSMDQGPANINLNGSGLIKVQSGSFSSLGTAASDVLSVYADVEISGGTVDLNGQNKFAGQLKVIGDSATINIDRLNTPPGGNIGELVFEMGATGISTINGIGFGRLTAYNLTVDGANYTGGSGTFTLYDCRNLVGVPASYTITNFAAGVSAVVTNDAATHSIILMLTVPGYQDWSYNYGVGATTNNEDGDVLNNLYEYALGGDPTNSAVLGMDSSMVYGPGYIDYIHVRRVAATNEIRYALALSQNLPIGSWTTNTGYTVVGYGPVVGDFDTVTNRIDTTGKTAEFIDLVIEELP